MMLPAALPVNRPDVRRRRVEGAVGDNTVRTLAADLAAVFAVDAPEVDLVTFGLLVAGEGRRREARS